MFGQLAPRLSVTTFVRQVGTVVARMDAGRVDMREVESNPVRWPDAKEAGQVVKLIERVRSEGDSLGGVVECVVRGCPVGLGEPVFDRLEADLAKGMMSLPASKGFEIGSGFAGVRMRGSEHNDEFFLKGMKVRTRTNRSGGVQGGISNGEEIIFRVAFKPVATISKAQKTVNTAGKSVELKARGRHDPCVLPRAVPMVEAMALLVLADHYLRDRAQMGLSRK
jgi:chorismate synthase